MSHGVTSATAGLDLQRRVRRPQRGDLRHLRRRRRVLRQQRRRPRATTSSARRSTSTATAPRCATWTSPARTARPRTPGTPASAASTSTTPRARRTTSSTCSPRAAAPRPSTASATTRPTSDGLPVTGIGRDKAAQIWFRALTTQVHLHHQLRGRPHRHPRGGAASCTARHERRVQGGGRRLGRASTSARAPAAATPTRAARLREHRPTSSIPDRGAAVTSSITVTGRHRQRPQRPRGRAWTSCTPTAVTSSIDLVAPDGTAYRLKHFHGVRLRGQRPGDLHRQRLLRGRPTAPGSCGSRTWRPRHRLHQQLEAHLLRLLTLT